MQIGTINEMFALGKLRSIVISVAKHYNQFARRNKINIEQLTREMLHGAEESSVDDDEILTDPENKGLTRAATKSNGDDSDDESAALGSESKRAASKPAASKPAASKPAASNSSMPAAQVLSLNYVDVMQEIGVTAGGGVSRGASSCDCSMIITGHIWLNTTDNPMLQSTEKYRPWLRREEGLMDILPTVNSTALFEMKTLKNVTINMGNKKRLAVVCCDILNGVHYTKVFEKMENPAWLFFQHQLKIHQERHNNYCAKKILNDKGEMVPNNDHNTGMSKQLMATIYYNTVNCLEEYNVEVRFMTKLKGNELMKMRATNPGVSQKADLVQMSHEDAMGFIKKQFNSKLTIQKRKRKSESEGEDVVGKKRSAGGSAAKKPVPVFGDSDDDE